MKKEFLLINGTVYPFDTLVTTASDKDLFNYIEKNKKYKLSEDEKKALILTGQGRTVMLIGGQIIVRLKKQKTSIGIDFTDLVHELEHATYFLFDFIGLKHSLESDEAYAYYISYLTRQVLDFGKFD